MAVGIQPILPVQAYDSNSSLSAVVACLMPYVFLLNSEEVDWGWSIGLLGIFLLAFSAFWIRSFFFAGVI